MAKPRPRPTGARLAACIDTHEGRLVYADWLEEQGDPLAATVRLFDEFLAFALRRAAEDYARSHPGRGYGRLGVTSGRVYWRVFYERQEDAEQSAFCFVRKADGTILECECWERPVLEGPPPATLQDRESWGRHLCWVGISPSCAAHPTPAQRG